jgi:hypothetical protein
LILIRTPSGQSTAFDEDQLDAPRRRLLLLVNGYTPLASLTARLDPSQDWYACARQLLEEQLICVEHERDSMVPSDLSPIAGDKPVEKQAGTFR